MDKQQLHRLYILEGLSTTQIGKQFGCDHKKILYWLNKHGIKTRNAGFQKNNKLGYKPCSQKTKEKISKANSGENNGQWKGGLYIKEGYLTIKQPSNPRADNKGRIKYHVYIAEKTLGRFLDESECIHHIDGDKLNNNPDNLYLFKTYGEHSAFHNSNKDWKNKLVSNIG